MHRPGVEPRISRSQVQRPNHYTKGAILVSGSHCIPLTVDCCQVHVRVLQNTVEQFIVSFVSQLIYSARGSTHHRWLSFRSSSCCSWLEELSSGSATSIRPTTVPDVLTECYSPGILRRRCLPSASTSSSLQVAAALFEECLNLATHGVRRR